LVYSYQPLKTSENHNSLTVAPNLVVLEPVVSLRYTNIIMHYILLFGVMLISPLPCLFVLLRVDEQATEDPGTHRWKILNRSSLKASCMLDHFYLPNNVLYNHYGMFRLNFDGTQ
jgi:hypothetical protein